MAARACSSTLGTRNILRYSWDLFKAYHFRTSKRLDVLQRGLLAVAGDFSWNLEAWAVFSNHYHFVAHSPGDSKDTEALSQMLGVLHTRTAGWVNHWTGHPPVRCGIISGIRSSRIKRHIWPD